MRTERSEIERRITGFREAARAAGIKLTHQRLEIFRAVAARRDHPDAEALYRAVKKRMPTVSLDTVYRTLALFGELGVVNALGPRHESVRFDANLAPHHHYVCVACGRTVDFESAALDALRLPDAVRKLGRTLTTYIEVRGVCKDCEKTKKTKNTQPKKSMERNA